ncbi:MAG: Ig-like domain-containing protein [Opitutales bacterium]
MFPRSLVLFVALSVCQALAADGPGFTQPTGYQPNDQLAQWDLSPGRSRTTTAGYHRGYLFSDTRDGIGIQTWDISDWNNVQRVGDTDGLGTNHHHFVIGDYYLNSSGHNAGPWANSEVSRVWDFSDMTNISILEPEDLEFPYIRRGGNKRRDWFTLPYVYTGQNGYHPPQPIGQIVDARTDEVLAELDYEADLGFPGQPLAIGNLLLVAASHARSGVAAYDVSDPRNPVLLDVITNTGDTFIGAGYEPSVWRHYVVLAMDQFGNTPDRVTLIDFSDPQNLRLAATINEAPGLSRYTQFQDEFMFVGRMKYNLEDVLNDPDGVVDGRNEYAENLWRAHDEYLLPLGNVVVTFGSGQDNARAIVHQSEPDTNPPYVSYHNPADGAVEQAVTTRIGLVINETLEASSINAGNIMVRPFGGDPIGGTFSQTDKDVVTFHPDELLAEDTTYEVILPVGGLSDVSGNALTEEFRFTFSTGPAISTVNQPPAISGVSYPYPVTAGVPSTLVVFASDPEAEGPLEYRWEFGDGSSSDWSSQLNIDHQFEAPGHYNVVVSVRDAEGLVTVRPMTVTVADPPSADRSGRHNTVILLDEDADLIWTVNPDNDTLTALNAETLTVATELEVGDEPRSVCQDPWGTLWVTLAEEDAVALVDPVEGLLGTVPFAYGAKPYGIVCDDAGNLYVSLEGSGQLARIDAESGELLRLLDLGFRPRALALNAEGERLFVTRFVSPDSAGEVWEVAVPDLTLTRTIQLAPETAPELDTGNNGRGLPNYLAGLAFSRDGSQLVVPSKKDNIFAGLARDGTELKPDTTVRAITSVVDVASGMERFGERIDLDNSAQPVAAWFSPLDDYLFVLLQGNNEIDVIDRFDGQIATRILTGLAPQGFVYDAGRERLYVKEFMDRTVSAIPLHDFLRTGRVPVERTETVSTVSDEALASNVLRGKQIFYDADDDRMSFQDYISCASCHLDGDNDGRVWDFTQRGEGLRNNITLNGREAMAHGNLHWTGNFNELQDFENDIRLHFGGEGFLPQEDWDDPDVQDPLGSKHKSGRSTELDALAAYVASLGHESFTRSPYRTGAGKFTLQAQRGQAVFDAANCASCHAGTTFTDGLRHDIGTLKPTSGSRLGGELDGIETPTLLGLHDGAPYLHDGSASTLKAVFEQFDASAPAGSDGRAHDLSAFSAQQRADLIRFLRELDGRDPPAQGFTAHAGVVAMEVESGAFIAGQQVWNIGSSADASGGAYVASVEQQYGEAPNSSEPERFFQHEFTLNEAGDYAFWVRLNSGSGRDSMLWRLTRPDGSQTPWRVWLYNFGTNGQWDWRRWSSDAHGSTDGTEFDNLTAGTYLLETTYRESNTWLDKFVIQRVDIPGPETFGPAESAIAVANPAKLRETSFADWLKYVGLSDSTTFDTRLGSGTTAGYAYAMSLLESPGHQPVQREATSVDHSEGEFVYRFVRFPNRTGTHYAIQAGTSLDSMATIATAEPGAESMAVLDSETYTIVESYSPDYPDGVVTTVRQRVGDTGFVRLVLTPVAD